MTFAEDQGEKLEWVGKEIQTNENRRGFLGFDPVELRLNFGFLLGTEL